MIRFSLVKKLILRFWVGRPLSDTEPEVVKLHCSFLPFCSVSSWLQMSLDNSSSQLWARFITEEKKVILGKITLDQVNHNLKS